MTSDKAKSLARLRPNLKALHSEVPRVGCEIRVKGQLG